jgi:hypothetical protein
VLVRDRNQQFPALLIASGTECRFNGHALISSKPITASLSGLNGGFLTALPETRIEIQSPEIKAGERFWIDNESIVAQTPGVVSFVISNPGEHAFHHD